MTEVRANVVPQSLVNLMTEVGSNHLECTGTVGVDFEERLKDVSEVMWIGAAFY